MLTPYVPPVSNAVTVVQIPVNILGHTNASPLASAIQELLNKENQVLYSIKLFGTTGKGKNRGFLSPRLLKH